MINRLRNLAQGRFLRDTAILQSGQFILIVVQASTNYVVVRVLGVDQLGIYTMIVTLAATVGLLDVTGSIRLGLIQLAPAIAAQAGDDIRDFLAYFLKVNLLVNVPMVAGFFVLGPTIALLYNGHAEIGAFARWLVLLELIEVPTQFLGLVYQSRREMRRLVSYESSKILATSLVTLVTVFLGWGISGLIFASLSVSIVFCGISVYRYHRLSQSDPLIPGWSALLRRLPSTKLMTRLRLGFLIAVDKNIGSFTDNLLILLLGLLGPTFLGNFRVALQIVTLPQPLITGLSRNLDVFVPIRAATGKQDVRSTFIRTTIFSGLIWAGVTIGIAVAAPFIIYLLFPNYVAALPLVYPLLLQSLAVGIGVGMGATLRTLHRLKESIVLQISVILVMIPIGLLAMSGAGGYGGALFFGFRELIQTGITIALLMYLLRVPKKRVESAS